MRQITLLVVILPLLGFCLATRSQAQDQALRGMVLNENRQPMEGVQVSVNGSPAVLTMSKTGQFQVMLPQGADFGNLNIKAKRGGYQYESHFFNAQKNELEISIRPINKTLGGWVRAGGTRPIGGAAVKFNNKLVERTATTDRDGFFRIQLPYETPVTVADFIVEAYKIQNGNVELRKVRDDNLKFVQENTFVFLNVSNEDQLVEVATTSVSETQGSQLAGVSATSAQMPTTAGTSKKDLKVTSETIRQLIESRRGTVQHATTIDQEIQQEIRRIEQEIKNLPETQEDIAKLRSHISNLLIELLKSSGNNSLATEIEKLKQKLDDAEQARLEMQKAKEHSEFQLGQITRWFQFSVFSAIALLVLGAVSVYFAINNYRKKRELQIKSDELTEQKRTLEILNEEMKTLMGIVAHDLKAPLNKVVGLTQLLPLVGTLNEEQNTYVTMVNQVAHDGRHFIENLLDLKSIEEQKRSLKIAPLEVMDWMRRSMVGYEQTATRKNIGLHLQSNESEAVVGVDKSAFGQIMDNLVSNAIKFSPHEKNVYVNVNVGYALVSISIKDEGPGISEEDQQKMFKKFQRLSARPTGGEHSSGLGLSIVKMLVEQMGGEVFLESQVGVGSTFTVYFPKHVPEEATVETPAMS